MAENKKGFLLYADLINTAEMLSDAKAGRLFKHILRYVNDKNPIAPDEVTALIFEPIKQSLKRDLDKYEKIIEKRRLAGKKSAENKSQKHEQVSTRVDMCEQVLTPVESVQQVLTDKDNVNVNDSVNDKEINIINNSVKKNASEEFFKIRLVTISGKPSEHAKKQHPQFLEMRLMQDKVSLEDFCEAFDAEYRMKQFTDDRHFQNAISATLKTLKTKNYTHGHKPATQAIESGRIKDLAGAKF